MIERLYDIVEYRSRICALMARGMTQRAATVVIDACMYGEGCLEGRVREAIEKAKPPCGHAGYCTAVRCLY